MSNENELITIEIRGREQVAVEAAEKVAALFLSSGPGRPYRMPSKDEVRVLVYVNAQRGPEAGGVPEPE
ncbi:hypothetical protein AB0G79_20165 [Streptomyces sp. NPDC020807]|uniref:hypothetical protein n=1 Tax=Streptomyces sp. NPDC020807 TaxID=3155119 RepID=UPI0033D4DFC9